MHRRTFVHALGASVAGGTLGSLRVRTARHLDRVGLELYSVRDAMRQDPDGTLAAVAAIGYRDVELLWSFGNFGRTPEQVRTALDRNGLRAPSAHISAADLFVGWERSLAIARLLGHEYLIVPDFPPDTVRSLDDWREWADRFNAAGAVARRSGIWLTFHNEPGHLAPLDGTVPYDLFLQRTDPTVVRHQLDVGNMALGGGDPFVYLERYHDRYWTFHLKDVVADRSRDTELGTGTLDFRRLLAAVPDLDRKPCYVEQEAAQDPLASVRRDYEFLSTLEF
jgi:sugar phosphate isomerase/epimerase